MTQIRVDPLQLLESAHQLAGLSAKLAELAEEAGETGASAPSYDGQFGPQVHAMAGELQVMITKQAQRLAELTADLRILSEEFARADHESASGIEGLSQALRDWASQLGILAEDGSLAWGPLSSFLLGMAQPREPLGPQTAASGDQDRPPWWGPLVLGMERIWSWFDSSVGEPLRDSPETWRSNLENLRIIEAQAAAQGWFAYDRTVNQFINERIETWKDNLAMLDVIWNEKLATRQEPGMPADGPLTAALGSLTALDSYSNPISQVGTELAHLIDGRGGVTATFSDTLTGGGNAGVTPLKGLIFLPNRYSDQAYQAEQIPSLLVAHELAHVLQRDLPEYPDGWLPAGSWIFNQEGGIAPFEFRVGSPALGDFTLYMEVQSNIIAGAIEYDFLGAERSQYAIGSREYQQLTLDMDQVSNTLATYTANPADACAYVLQDHRYAGTGFYTGEMVREVLLGPRIPPGGWDYWLAQQGFSEAAITHIADIAAAGTPNDVWLSGMLDYDWQPSQAVPTATPTPTPTPTPTATPIPTPAPAASETPPSPTMHPPATPESR
jgi:hypothetical protein